MSDDCPAVHPIHQVQCEVLTAEHRFTAHEAQCGTFKAVWVSL